MPILRISATQKKTSILVGNAKYLVGGSRHLVCDRSSFHNLKMAVSPDEHWGFFYPGNLTWMPWMPPLETGNFPVKKIRLPGGIYVEFQMCTLRDWMTDFANKFRTRWSGTNAVEIWKNASLVWNICCCWPWWWVNHQEYLLLSHLQKHVFPHFVIWFDDRFISLQGEMTCSQHIIYIYAGKILIN